VVVTGFRSAFFNGFVIPVTITTHKPHALDGGCALAAPAIPNALQSASGNRRDMLSFALKECVHEPQWPIRRSSETPAGLASTRLHLKFTRGFYSFEVLVRLLIPACVDALENHAVVRLLAGNPNNI
jgi:hypothetical protein